jgi:hypothetical protein
LNTPFDENVPRDKRGCLRLYLQDEIVDVVPRQGRSIIFLSEHLWHSVQPLCDSADRYALTLWFNHVVKLQPKPVESKAGSIFVAIPCYRDIELIKTLMSLIGQAVHPEKLRIAIFLQIKMSEDVELID